MLAEITVEEIQQIVFFPVVHIPFPFPLQADLISGQVNHFHTDQGSEFWKQEGVIALHKDDICRFDFNLFAPLTQLAVERVAGSGADEIISRRDDLFALADFLQATLEKVVMQSFLAQGINPMRFAIIAVGEEVVHFDGGDFLPGVRKSFAKPGDDFCLSGRGLPGDGDDHR